MSHRVVVRHIEPDEVRSLIDDDDSPLFVCVERARRRLGIGRTLAWRLIASGELPSKRFGGRVLVPVEWLERLSVERIPNTKKAAEAEPIPLQRQVAAFDMTEQSPPVPLPTGVQR